MNVFSKMLHKVASRMVRYSDYYRLSELRSQLGFCDKNVVFKLPRVCSCPKKIFLYNRASVYEDAMFIISPKGENGRFIMKGLSGAAQGLTVITGNHHRAVDKLMGQTFVSRELDDNKDVVVEEEVWMGCNVTLLSGVTLGRGSTVGTGSVCTKSVPPYSIVIGNPAKVIGFNYTPDEALEHERLLYPEKDRLPKEVLERNYQKYFKDRVGIIRDYLKL